MNFDDRFLNSLAVSNSMVSTMSTISSAEDITSKDMARNTEEVGETASFLSEISKTESITGTKFYPAYLSILFW